MLPEDCERDSLQQGSRWPELRGLAEPRNEHSSGGMDGRDSQPWLPLNDKQLELEHV